MAILNTAKPKPKFPVVSSTAVDSEYKIWRLLQKYGVFQMLIGQGRPMDWSRKIAGLTKPMLYFAHGLVLKIQAEQEEAKKNGEPNQERDALPQVPQQEQLSPV